MVVKYRFQDIHCKEPISVIIPDKSFKNKIIVHLVRLQHGAKLETILTDKEGWATYEFKGPIMVFGNVNTFQWLQAIEKKNDYKFILIDNNRSSREKYAGLRNKEIKTDKTLARVLFEYYKLPEDSWLLDYTDEAKLWKWPKLSMVNLKAGIEALNFDIEKLWKMDIQAVAAIGSDAILKKVKVEEAKTEKECKDEPEKEKEGTGSKGKGEVPRVRRNHNREGSAGGRSNPADGGSPQGRKAGAEAGV